MIDSMVNPSAPHPHRPLSISVFNPYSYYIFVLMKYSARDLAAIIECQGKVILLSWSAIPVKLKKAFAGHDQFFLVIPSMKAMLTRPKPLY